MLNGTSPAGPGDTARGARNAGAPAPAPPLGGPWFQVVRGHPSAEELAALTAALSVRLAASPVRQAARQAGGWADRSRLLRRAPSPGPGAWRRSAQPR